MISMSVSAPAICRRQIRRRPIDPVYASSNQHLRRLLEQAVAPTFDVGRTELWIGTRGGPVSALARQVAMYLAHVHGGLSYTEIGRLFARDRTTVAHACCVIEDRREDAAFDRAIGLLESVLHMRPHGLAQSARW
jgi:chromosomal replication initiation ATPase DnaA